MFWCKVTLEIIHHTVLSFAIHLYICCTSYFLIETNDALDNSEYKRNNYFNVYQIICFNKKYDVQQIFDDICEFATQQKATLQWFNRVARCTSENFIFKRAIWQMCQIIIIILCECPMSMSLDGHVQKNKTWTHNITIYVVAVLTLRKLSVVNTNSIVGDMHDVLEYCCT